jgi:outer membrane protein TolC
LYDFGSRDANLENANELLRAASATQNTTVQTVLLAAVNAFYQVHATRAVLNASIDSERLYQESFKSAEAKYIAGVATPADKLQAQTSFANATLTKLKNEGALKIAYGNLANIMGVPANINFQMADSQLDVIPELVDQDIEASANHRNVLRHSLESCPSLVSFNVNKPSIFIKICWHNTKSRRNHYHHLRLWQHTRYSTQIAVY